MAAQSSIIDKHSEIMFDEGNRRPFLRVYKMTSNGNGNGFSDFGLDGSSYSPTGNVVSIAEKSKTAVENLFNRNSATDFNSVRISNGTTFLDPRTNAPVVTDAPVTVAWTNNTNLVQFDCGDCAQLFVRITGTFTGTISMQGDNNVDFAAAYAINALNATTNAIVSTVTATNTNLIIPIRSRFFRLRYTSAGTGAAIAEVSKLSHETNANFTTLSNATIAVTQSGSWSVGQSGTWNNTIAPSTAQGYSTGSSLVSAGTTNATLIKTGATNAGWLRFTNTGGTCFLRLYNKVTTPIPGTDVALNIVALLPNESFDMQVAAGIRYPLGLGFALTRNAGLADATAINANEVIGTWMVV
jgi:hypothetical protein